MHSRIIQLIILGLVLISCPKQDFDKKSDTNLQQDLEKEIKIKREDNEAAFSVEETIKKYCPNAFSSEYEVEDYYTLDVNNFDLKRREIPANNEGRFEYKDNVYKQDFFQIYVPEEMYITDTYVNDGVILKRKDKNAFIYIMSPQWTNPSVYLYFDFNNMELSHINGYRDLKMTFSESYLKCEYYFPNSVDGYVRYVMINKGISFGMSVFVLIYKETEIQLDEMKILLAQVLSQFMQFAD